MLFLRMYVSFKIVLNCLILALFQLLGKEASRSRGFKQKVAVKYRLLQVNF